MSSYEKFNPTQGHQAEKIDQSPESFEQKPNNEVENHDQSSDFQLRLMRAQEQYEKDAEALKEISRSLGIEEDLETAPSLVSQKEAISKMLAEQGLDGSDVYSLEKNNQQIEAYEKVKQQAERIAANIDPELSARIINAKITIDASGEIYDDVVLSFEHQTQPQLCWTMNIDTDDWYLSNKLPAVVAKIYQAKIAKKQEDYDPNFKQYEDLDFTIGQDKIEQMLANEKVASAEQIGLQADVNNLTNQLRLKYGLEPIDVPVEAVHEIEESAWTGEGGASFIENETSREILIKECPSLTVMAKKLIHEMIHYKSTNVLPRWLNEAVTERMTIRAMDELSTNPVLQKELNASSEFQEAFADYWTTDGSPLITADTYFAYLDQQGRVATENFSYQSERHALEQLTDRIWRNHPDQFKSSADVFDLLERVTMTGDKKILVEQLGEDFLERVKIPGNY